jgi:hypothetical protein
MDTNTGCWKGWIELWLGVEVVCRSFKLLNMFDIRCVRNTPGEVVRIYIVISYSLIPLAS